MESQCYPDWCHFKGILPKLSALAAEEFSDECKILENLAATGADSNDFPSTDGVSVFATTAFFVSPCYTSFVNHRVKTTLDQAYSSFEFIIITYVTQDKVDD